MSIVCVLAASILSGMAAKVVESEEGAGKASAWPDNPTWVKWTGNPVLGLGGSGDFDAKCVSDASVMYNGTSFSMWYCGADYYDWNMGRIGYAESGDGKSWVKRGVVMDKGQSGSCDDVALGRPAVVFDGSKYRMWYSAFSTTGMGGCRIGYATSVDGTNWTRHGIGIDTSSSGFDSYYTYRPTAVYLNGSYYLWYSGNDAGSKAYFGLATSSDGESWTKKGRITIDGNYLTYGGEVIFSDGKFRMWYESMPSSAYVARYATSDDGLSWTDRGLAVDQGDTGQFDRGHVFPGAPVRVGNDFWMWYTGHDGISATRIGLATFEYSIAPVAYAGPDQAVDEGTLVRFNGSGSKDDLGIVNYTWSFTDGALVRLYGVGPTYRFDNPGVFAVTLNVSDADGNWDIDAINVTVRVISAPVADAGPDQTVDEGASVTFDGRASTDTAGIVGYAWSFTDGGPVRLSGVQPTYQFDNPGLFVVTLNVTNVAGKWDTDIMNVTVNDTTAPVADAGPDLAVDEDTPVGLDGNGSTDNVGIVNHTWTFTDKAPVTLYGVHVSYEFGDPGTYVVTLTVTDAAGNGGSDWLTVTVNDTTAPVADTGPDMMADQGTVLTLNGSGSSDNGGIVNWTWTFKDEATVTLHGAQPTYSFNNAGFFIVTLEVLDSAGNRGHDNLTVTVNDTTAPVGNAGPDRAVDEDTPVELDGSGSADNVGIVNWTWTFIDTPSGSPDNPIWVRWAANPMLNPGNSGDFDEKHVSHPSVIHDGTSYMMWYCGADGNDFESGRIGFATSADGNSWVKRGMVMDRGPTGSCDGRGLGQPSVVFDGSTYRMWYSADSSGPSMGDDRIAYATSPDGMNWTKHGIGLERSPFASDFDSYYTRRPTVVHDSGFYWMWYSGSDGGNRAYFGLATSADGENWTRKGRITMNGEYLASCGRVIRSDGKFRMWYESYAAGYCIARYATSDDGLSWTDHGPALDRGNMGQFDGGNLYPGAPVQVGGRFFMWYTGHDGSTTTRIGLASTDFGSPVTLHGVHPAYRFENPGTFNITLEVRDAAGNRDTDTLTLTVKDTTPPVADAGAAQKVPAGSTVILNGLLSSDNGVIAKRFWNFTYGGKALNLEGETVLFRFDNGGVYEVLLTVVDGAGHKAQDRLVITVIDTGLVTGTVRDVKGNPIAGATVKITAANGNTSTTKTAANGTFSVEIFHGPFSYIAMKDGYRKIAGNSSVKPMGEVQLMLREPSLKIAPGEPLCNTICNMALVLGIALAVSSTGGWYIKRVRDRRASARAVFLLEHVTGIMTQNGWEMKSAAEQSLRKEWNPDWGFNPLAIRRYKPGVLPAPPGASGAIKRFQYSYRDPEGDPVGVDFYLVWRWMEKDKGDAIIPYIGGKPSPELHLGDYLVVRGDKLELMNSEELSSEIQKRFGSFSLALGILVPRKCPSCGAVTEAPMSQASVKCEYCETKFEVKDGKQPETGQGAAPKAAAGPTAGTALTAAPGEGTAPAMTPEEHQAKLRQLDELLLNGKISESTFLDLRKRYEEGR